MIGELKSLELLWLHLASNQRYESLIEDMDFQVFGERLSNEGLSFLTQGLPSIGKALDRFHSTQEWVPPVGFTTHLVTITKIGHAGEESILSVNVPYFLGRAIESALAGNPTAVDCVRQLSYLFYKLEVPHDKGVTDRFLDRFIQTDLELGQFRFDDQTYYEFDDRVFLGRLIKTMKGLISRILGNEDPRDIVPSHGSGATACRTPNHQKYHLLRYYPSLDGFFPYGDYFFFNHSHLCDEMDKLEQSLPCDPKARVCLVPKDSRGPRIISCEPAELMFIQQGLMRKLYGILEKHPLTRGQLNFTDQTINRFLAQQGSLFNTYATIDLADASDRVSLSLIRAVFPPIWVEALEACRSEYTVLPDGREIKLNKFAPMGSSCCFPVEALVFWACAKAALHIRSGFGTHPVYVYGDDIITHPRDSRCVIESLESVGLLVNRDKCFLSGPFRESCGGDYYNGIDVTPVRLRHFPSMAGTRFETTADFINNLIDKFGYDSVYNIVHLFEHHLGYAYPRTLMVLPGTIRAPLCASNDVMFRRRWNKSLQRYEHRILQLVCKVKQHHPANWSELLRKELSRGLTSVPDRYLNPLAIADSKLDPGHYTDTHSVCTKWVWTWLG
jgi:hypothetical protein